MAKVDPIPGTSDLRPDDCVQWRLLEDAAHSIFARYGYGELRTPIFERTDVFVRAIGDETDVVQKEMYTFEDRGGRSLTLRPEGTAGVMRALASMGIAQGDQRRVYYQGAMFRGERPAAGRKRQFHQVGAECVGPVGPGIDVECIAMLVHYIREIGITDTRLLLNSRGTAEDRRHIGEELRTFFEPHRGEFCEDCQRRLETNIWRILDCKQARCGELAAQAPEIPDLLSEESRAYFDAVCEGLGELGVEFEIDPRLVRGLDYYAHTVFEVAFSGIGAQTALAGGGRYVIQPPGCKNPLEGIGFAAGMERLLLAREACGVKAPAVDAPDVYLVGLGKPAQKANAILAQALRNEGFCVGQDGLGRGMKPQMKAANRSGARVALIRGDNELETGVIQFRNMHDGEQEEISVDDIRTRLLKAREATT